MHNDLVHVIPVGFEEDRAIYGIAKLGASRIYLLTDDKKGIWGNEARKHAERVKKRLWGIAFNKEEIKEVGFDPTDFKSCQDTITEILSKEKDVKRIFLNISTSTKLCAVAFTLASMEFKNSYLYYVVPKEYNLPPGGSPFSSGARRVELFSPRDLKFSEWEVQILRALHANNISSLRELNMILVPEDVSKAMIAKLSYYVRKLQTEGLVAFRPGSRIGLTDLGLSRINPPTDDADIVIR
jgi:hypothetical protein